ncbi:MAG TPA: hypothetical protein DEA08_33145 [Planctomycetes bacterium]|nr:hypothetical protein [Planctomycetota bacterium]
MSGPQQAPRGLGTVRLRKRFVHAGTLGVVATAVLCLAGFVRISFTPGGAPFKWSSNLVTYVIQSAGSDDVSDDSEKAAIRLAFRAWEQVEDSVIRFQEDTGADATRTDFGANDIRMVIFDEDGSSGFFPSGSNIIALTPITASTVDGTIFDADIVFNGKLSFTTNPGQDTSRFDIQAVATHEVGHFIGLDHSGGPKATMFTTIPGGTTYARSLCADDEAGAATVYPSGGNGRGTIQGSVNFNTGGGLAYAQVIALTNPGGIYAGQALSDSSGTYRLEGLPPGNYDLYVEPLDGPFRIGDTIALKNQTVSSFRTTWAPQNPVTVTAGGTTGATWSAVGSPTLNVNAGSGGRIPIGASGQLVIGGAGLDNVDSVRIPGSGVVVENFTSGSPITLTVTISANAGVQPGPRTLEVKRGSGEVAVLTAGIDVVTPPPTLSSVAPTTLLATGGTNVTIDGTGFVQGSQVIIGGQLATGVTFGSSTQMSCVAPVSPGTSLPVDVVVMRPDGEEARLVGAVSYEVAPAPVSIDPAIGPISGGTTHVIKGSGFGTPATVTFNGVDAQVLSVSASEIRVRLPANEPGTVTVSVTAGGKTGTLSGFTYVDGAAPVVDSLSPTSGPLAGGTLVTLSGSGFDSDAQVRFGGTLAASSGTTSTALSVLTPAASNAGLVEVRVTNPSTGLSTLAGTFTYSDTVAAAPPAGGGGGSSSDCALSDPSGGAPGSAWLLVLLSLVLVVRRRR